MMMEIISIKPLLAVLVSLTSAALIIASYRWPNVRESWSIGAGIIKFLIIASMIPVILRGDVIQYTLFTLLPGVAVKFRVDAFGLFFGITASFLWIMTTLY